VNRAVTLATDTEGVTKTASTGVLSSTYLLSRDSASSSVTFMAVNPGVGSRRAPLTMQPSFAGPSPSPIVRAETPRSSCGMLLTSCASEEPGPLSSLVILAAIFHGLLPISPFVPAPFCAVKPPILFGSVDFPAGLFPNRLMTRSLKSFGPTSPPVTAFACALLEAAEAHCLESPWFPLDLDSGDIV
jgi:hypothetical protein